LQNVKYILQIETDIFLFRVIQRKPHRNPKRVPAFCINARAGNASFYAEIKESRSGLRNAQTERLFVISIPVQTA